METSPSVREELLREIIDVTGDTHSARFFKRVVRLVSEEQVHSLLSETKQAIDRGGLDNPGAYFVSRAKAVMGGRR